MAEKNHIEVICYCCKQTFQWSAVPISEEISTIEDVLKILAWDIDLSSIRLSIWGRPAKLSQAIMGGERIEITQPLQRTPNEMRLIRKRLSMLQGHTT